MTGKWSQLQRCDSLRRSFTHSVKHVPDSACHAQKKLGGCASTAWTAPTAGRPLAVLASTMEHTLQTSKLHSSTTKALTTNQTSYIHRRAEPNCNNVANCSLALKVHVTLNASDRRDNGCIANYSPLLAMALSCPNWHKLLIE